MVRPFWHFCLLLLAMPLFLLARHPELTPHDTRLKIEEILRNHAIYHALNEELMARALTNFAQELDPNYCYLLESETLSFTEQTSDQLQQILKDLQDEKFRAFEAIYSVMLKAIERRRALETQIGVAEIPENVDPEEFKDMTWAKTSEELKTRLKRIKGLQMKTARKILSPQEQAHFQKRLEKRRISRE